MIKDLPEGLTHHWCENHGNCEVKNDRCCCHFPTKDCVKEYDPEQPKADWEEKLQNLFIPSQVCCCHNPNQGIYTLHVEEMQKLSDFIRFLLAKQKQEILSEIEKKYLGDNCTDKHDGKICGRPIHVRYQAGYNRALVDVTEIVNGPTNKRKEGCEIQIS